MRTEAQRPVRYVSFADDVSKQWAEATDAAAWSFEQVFERACADVQAIFREHHVLPGHLIVRLKDGPIVVTPFAWASEAEQARLYERLSNEYHGRVEFYIIAMESLAGDRALPSALEAAPERIATVAGINLQGTVLARRWEIRPDPVLRLVEQEDQFPRDETVRDLFFTRMPALDPSSGRM